jgi:hypothetical protein
MWMTHGWIVYGAGQMVIVKNKTFVFYCFLVRKKMLFCVKIGLILNRASVKI